MRYNLPLTDAKLQEYLDKTDDREDLHPTKRTRRPRYFCGVLLWRFNPIAKVFELVMLDYKEEGTGPVQIKMPGGCSEFGETPRNCAFNETKEETGLMLSRDAKIIYYNAMSDSNDESVIDHLHLFFEQELQYVQHTPFLKTKSESDKGECSNVRWEPINQGLVSKIFKSHRPALKALYLQLMAHEATKSVEKYNALANLNFPNS